MMMLALEAIVASFVYDRVIIGPLMYKSRDVEVDARRNVTPGCESSQD
jgi:hypothetical protein